MLILSLMLMIVIDFSSNSFVRLCKFTCTYYMQLFRKKSATYQLRTVHNLGSVIQVLPVMQNFESILTLLL